jgi:hypothetical protein
MAARSIDALADQLGVDSGDIRVLLGTYGPEVTDLWEEQDVVTDAATMEVLDQFDPWCFRTVPEVWWPALKADRQK